ncbi:MAG: TrmH family RNA methyltransferase [Patescibacteria group bacterium]|mgnify:CR=1 FL=1
MKICVLVLDNIRSVENTGSIFRTAECFGVSKIILVGTTPAPTDRFGRKRKDFAKVALGAEKLVNWKHVDDLKSQILNLKKEGYKIVALEQHSKSKNLSTCQVDTLGKLALIVGNEVEGVSRGVLDIVDEIVEIPMKGKKESLNVAVATGITLFKLCK